MKCPFCSGEVRVVVGPPDGVMHSVPYCKKFDKEDALTFLRNVRRATKGPVSPSDLVTPLSDFENIEEFKKS